MEGVKRMLFDKLKAFYDDSDFVIGVISNAPHEDDMRTVLDYLEHGEGVTVESVILLSLELGSERK